MSRRPLPLLLSLLITLLLITAFRASAQEPPSPTLISLSSTGEPGNGNSSSPSISSDGRWIAYASDATNLVPTDTNGIPDIFVHDRQTGETTRVSVSTNGEQANGKSIYPVISGNGRYVAFQSDATNLVPADTNGLSDIFVHDRLTGETKRVSVGVNGEQANGESSNVSIAYDGRYLAYQTMASNLVRGDDNGAWDVYMYDNGVTGNVVRASVSSEGVGGNMESVNPQISGDGRFVSFISSANNLVLGDTNNVADVFVYHRVLVQTERISVSTLGDQADGPSLKADISESGRFVVFTAQAPNLSPVFDEIPNIYVHDRTSGRTIPYGLAGLNLQASPVVSDDANYLALGINFPDSDIIFVFTVQERQGTPYLVFQSDFLKRIQSDHISITANGNMLVFAASELDPADGEKIFQIYSWELFSDTASHFLSGRVTDPLNHPLALVTVTDSLGNSTRTDRNGYFWLAGYKPGPVTLTLEKEGYTLTPATFTLQLSTDSPSLTFTATPTAPLDEARLDLGMPYQFDRGCPDPYTGCGGKFHGFTSGFCTDLILDAYTYGAAFDIQFDLEQDTRAHPEHFYRWHDARDAHDMWRFFSYSGQMLPNTAPYAPGDIVFFDWTEDGEIDHVALVSEVDGNAHPLKLLDATGKTDYNPSGLAAELPWQEFYDRTARGHARWTGAYQPIIPFPAKPQMLQIAASGANINLRLNDSAGGALSLTENTLPNGWYTNLIWEESASVEVQNGDTPVGGTFAVELSNPTGEPAPFRLAIQLVANRIVIGRVEATGSLPPNATRSIPIFVTLNADGTLTLTAFPTRLPKIRGPFKH